MTVFVGEINGNIQFFDDAVSKVHDGCVEISDSEHQKLILAQYKGAEISITGSAVSAVDWEGREIDLDKMEPDSFYGKRSTPTVKQQAQQALSIANTQAMMAVAMGRKFGPEMRKYVEQLEGIIGGTDNSSEIPVAPTDPTD